MIHARYKLKTIPLFSFLEKIYLGLIGHTGGFVGRNNAYITKLRSLEKRQTGRFSRASEDIKTVLNKTRRDYVSEQLKTNPN